MFGEGVFDEITSNIFCTKGYPPALSICIVIFIAIIPLTKIPLKYRFTRHKVLVDSLADDLASARPIIVTIETICGLDVRRMSSSSTIAGLPGYARGLLKCVIRIATSTVITLIAILVPSFDTIMALMGSALAFSICIIFPVAFHLKLFGSHISRAERVLDWGLILACSIMAIVGTVWVFLPKEMVGAD